MAETQEKRLCRKKIAKPQKLVFLSNKKVEVRTTRRAPIEQKLRGISPPVFYPTLRLVLRTQEVVDRLHRVEGRQGHLDHDGAPVTHRSIP